MKFSVPVTCSSCGNIFPAEGRAEERFPAATCPNCEVQIYIFDPLSISVVADRLLHRSNRETIEGDYTLSIICSAMAVECALTQVFMKWKDIDHLKSKGGWGSEEERDGWVKEYRKGTSPGGFERSANFVSMFLCGKQYDEFVSDFVQTSNTAALIKAGFPQRESQLKATFVHQKLFDRRNRIMHWAKVDYQQEDASSALNAACNAVAVLKVMDKEKNDARERAWRESQNQPSTTT
jgi:hypothetical protein